MERVRFRGQNLTGRETQIVEALLATHGTLMMATFPDPANLTAEQSAVVLQLTKEYGQKYFPDLLFYIE